MRAGIELKCKRCGYEWTYKGKKKPERFYHVYVACPRCKTSVPMPKEEQ